MYRDNDRRLFMIFGAIANVLLLSAFSLAVLYHFYVPRLIFRDVALYMVIVSALLNFQMILQKQEIMEKRIMSLLDPSLRRGKLESGASGLALTLYVLAFWTVVIAILVAYIPASWQEDLLYLFEF